jgi:CheY-like chemotaxis protein
MAILDLGDEPAEAAATCALLREVQPGMPVLFYGKRPLTGEEEALLRRYSDCIIQATAQAEQRMVENIERFLRQMPEAAPEQPFAQGGATREKKLAGHSILVVDDDPRNLFVITSALEQQGANVHSALNGKKALEFLSHNRVDLVFMDIMMPEMDGYQAIRLIRQNAAMKETPIVALTAKALRADREQARAAGADDYLAKPVDYEVLVNMAAVWCEGRR